MYTRFKKLFSYRHLSMLASSSVFCRRRFIFIAIWGGSHCANFQTSFCTIAMRNCEFNASGLNFVYA